MLIMQIMKNVVRLSVSNAYTVVVDHWLTGARGLLLAAMGVPDISSPVKNSPMKFVLAHKSATLVCYRTAEVSLICYFILQVELH